METEDTGMKKMAQVDCMEWKKFLRYNFKYKESDEEQFAHGRA